MARHMLALKSVTVHSLAMAEWSVVPRRSGPTASGALAGRRADARRRPGVPPPCCCSGRPRPEPGGLHAAPTATMAFAGGAYVYPGGGVDPRDDDQPVAWAGPSRACGRRLAPRGRRDGAQAWCAPPCARRSRRRACCSPGPTADSVVADTTRRRLGGRPAALVGRSCPSPSSWTGAGWCCAPTCWAPGPTGSPPSSRPRRYDTWFFVAALPEGQRTRDAVQRGRPHGVDHGPPRPPPGTTGASC